MTGKLLNAEGIASLQRVSLMRHAGTVLRRRERPRSWRASHCFPSSANCWKVALNLRPRGALKSGCRAVRAHGEAVRPKAEASRGTALPGFYPAVAPPGVGRSAGGHLSGPSPLAELGA